MDHDALREVLSDHRDGILAGPAQIELERHLESCAACRADLAAMERAGRALFGAPGALLTAGFAERVLAEVAGPPAAVSRVLEALDGWGGPALALGLAAAAAVAVLPAPEAEAAQDPAFFLSADRGLADWVGGERGPDLLAMVEEP